MRVLYRATPIVTRGTRFNGHLQGPLTPTPIAERLALKLSLPLFSSPELKAQVTLTDHSLSVFRRCCRCRKGVTFSSFSPETTGPI